MYSFQSLYSNFCIPSNSYLFSRQVNKSKSVLEVLLFRNDQNADDLRNKNIRQTELLVDLREAILQVGRHFQVNDYYVYLEFFN